FLGLINTGGDPKVIEYNVRMGDPETEVVMPRLASDLVDLAEAAAAGNLGDLPAEERPEAAATVIAVSGGYPGSYPKGFEITGNLQPQDSTVYHAGTKIDGAGKTVTSGGRVLAVTSLAPSLEEALKLSYKSLNDIHFDGMNYRRDIGADVL
ncbi:MAG: phosphoribosylamine--glycine ligase, partial [Muribaculaceae bacterium]|nr:phosphoribosylamine--glycine ligase [Muribaculaceae bacterium]